ncbi:MAG: FtsX-like permease family protein [Proteobacteria bacterium]|nr:FtsX-like permease family protein [Pseudomonadota bacterium]
MTPLASTRAVARAAGGGFAHGRGRSVVAILAIASGVALAYAVELVNRSAVSELVSGLAVLSGTSDLEVRGPGAGFDERIYPRLAQDPDVAAASPVLEVRATVAGRDDPLTIYGVDVFRASAITPALIPAPDRREDALRGDVLFPSPAARRWLGVATGDRVQVRAAGRALALRVAGTAGETAGARAGAARYAIMDIAAVQRDFDRLGRISRVDLRLREGADRGEVVRRLQRWLPPGVVATPPSAARDASAEASRAYRVNLDVLALVALVTGAMLVFATQTLSLARRRQSLALLRTLGLARRRLVAFIVAESAWLGIAGSIAGLALGYGVAGIAVRHFGPDLGGGYFGDESVPLRFDPIVALAMALLGTAAAIAGGLAPALEAASVAPASALRASDPDARWGRRGEPWRRNLAAVLGVVAAVAAAALPQVGGLPVAGYASIALLLAAAIAAMPSLARAAVSLLPMPGPGAGRLALLHLRAIPGRTAVSLAAMVTSVALMVSMAIMVASFRDSFEAWLAVMLPADLYVRASPAETGVLTADEQQRMRALGGAARIEFSRSTKILLDPGKPPVALLARDVDPRHPAARLALIGPSVDPSAGPPPAWVSEVLADERGLTVGSVLDVPLAGERVPFTIAGVWRDYARPQGAIVVERSRFEALTGDTSVNEAAIWIDRGTDPGEVRRELLRQLPADAGTTVISAGDLRRRSLGVFDRTFAVTYALEAASVAIGLVALSASLVAQTVARRREFGMLRHLGLTRRQLARMLAFEGGATGAIGTVTGLGVGLAISVVLIEVVNPQSFHWTIDFVLPWRGLLLLAAALVALSALTGWASSRGATRSDAVRAVRDDW